MTSTSSGTVARLVASLAVAMAIGLANCGGGHHVSDVIDTQTFQAALDGSNETPPVDTSGSGDADFVSNHALNTIAFDFRTTGLGNITGVFVQVGDPGTNGPVIFTLSNDSSSDGADTLGSSDLMPAPDAGINSIDDAINAMIDGRTYVNVTTEAHPDGEIRGQINEN